MTLRRAVVRGRQNVDDGPILYLPKGANGARGSAHLIEIGQQRSFRDKQCFKKAEDFSAKYSVVKLVLDSFTERTVVLHSHLLELTLMSEMSTAQITPEADNLFQELQAKELEGTVLRANVTLSKAAKQALDFTAQLGSREVLNCKQASARKVDQPSLIWHMAIAGLDVGLPQRCESWNHSDKVKQEEYVTSIMNSGDAMVDQFKGDKDLVTEVSKLVDWGLEEVSKAINDRQPVPASWSQESLESLEESLESFKLAKDEIVARLNLKRNKLKAETERHLKTCSTSTPSSYVAPEATETFSKTHIQLVKKFKL